jgi:hypothetical protein
MSDITSIINCIAALAIAVGAKDVISQHIKKKNTSQKREFARKQIEVAIKRKNYFDLSAYYMQFTEAKRPETPATIINMYESNDPFGYMIKKANSGNRCVAVGRSFVLRQPNFIKIDSIHQKLFALLGIIVMFTPAIAEFFPIPIKDLKQLIALFFIKLFIIIFGVFITNNAIKELDKIKDAEDLTKMK